MYLVGVQPSMSIIIHFNTTSFIPSSVILPSMHSYVSKTQKKLIMVPGIDETDQTVMTDDESSMVDIATSNTLYTHAIDLKSTNHVLGSCFGLPYQDHNYGAPPPPTPPNHSPCNSPAHANGVPDEDTNLSIVSASTANEETQSITRCICGFEHDDEYMICCDHCLVWQHVDCMGLDRNNIPETYLCEKCEPRKVDRHKAKVLQTRKKVAMTDSSDSDDDGDIKNADRKQRNRKRKRKDTDKSDEKLEQVHGRKRQIHKHSKERIESKRSKLRRTKNKESTSTADEEAQDAWESSLEWCEKNFETAASNQYTPEVQLLAKDLPKMGYEEKFMELLLTRNCKVVEGNQKKLISVYDIPRDQPLIEFKGKFLLASQFYDLHPAFSKRLFPYVMFYSLNKDEICVDATGYGNEARFIRRSCKPNAELHHLVHNGNLHLYISSTKAVFKDDEITLPLDFANLKEGIKDIECACESDDCIVKLYPKNGNIDMSPDKRRKGRKLFLSADDDSSHSFHGSNASPTKIKSVIKINSQSHEASEGKYETEEQANERKKKTREERKLDAIMRAFEQMEKAAKRRQQALERQKAHHPKTEEVSEKSESTTTSKDDDKATTASGSETQGGEEEKAHIPITKPKKGKRRRGSGTPARRRTRTNSGGSDILSPEENVLTKNIPISTSDQVLSQDSVIETTSCTTTSSSTIPVSSTALSDCPVSPVVLKTKRLLLNEWLQEKSETNTNPPTTSTVSAHTEVKWNTTAASSTMCYVQCTKDNPHSGGISAAHLRRSSSSSQIRPLPLKSCSEQGFTKKRWLRQAMFDCNSYDEPLTIDPGSIEGYPFDNCYLSPTSHGELSSPGPFDDTITPLKKRRLLRESVESPLSPTVFSSEGPADTSQNSTDTVIKLETEMKDSDPQLLLIKNDSSELPSIPEDKSCKISDLMKASQEHPKEADIKEELSKCENKPSVLHKPKCEVYDDLSISSDCKILETSMQINCDLKNKTYDCIKNFIAGENDSTTTQTDCEVISTVNTIAASVDLCTDKSLQPNCVTESKITDTIKNLKFETINKDHNAELKVVPSEDNYIQCNVFENSSSSKSVCHETKNELSDTNEIISDADVKQTQFELKLSKEEVCNVLSEDNSVVSVTCERAKDSCTNSVSSCPDKDSSITTTENSDVSLSISSDCHNYIVHCGDTLTKNTLTDVSTGDSESLCGNSVLSDDVNINNVKSSETSNLDSNSSQLSSENSSLASASATQKRKVSLSEYRLRMKDGFNKRINSENAKKIVTTPATAIPETLPEKVTLAPLPLFNTAAISKSPPETPLKAPKLKKDLTENEKKRDKECYIDIIEPRENLTERLKREFGFDDESEGIPPVFNSQCGPTNTNTSAMPLCTQPLPPPLSPPPPPPPFPRPVKSSQLNINVDSAASSSQFGFTLPTSYARPSYIVPQVPNAQFIPVQQTVNMPVLSSVHPVVAPGVQSTLIPSPHSFPPSLSGTVLQPLVQQEFSSINAQNYAALVQRPPLPQSTKTYSHVCQQSLYK